VPNEIGLARGQCEQAVKLDVRDDMATRHCWRVPMEVRSGLEANTSLINH
jgi:hypothetical protein